MWCVAWWHSGREDEDEDDDDECTRAESSRDSRGPTNDETLTPLSVETPLTITTPRYPSLNPIPSFQPITSKVTSGPPTTIDYASDYKGTPKPGDIIKNIPNDSVIIIL